MLKNRDHTKGFKLFFIGKKKLRQKKRIEKISLINFVCGPVCGVQDRNLLNIKKKKKIIIY